MCVRGRRARVSSIEPFADAARVADVAAGEELLVLGAHNRWLCVKRMDGGGGDARSGDGGSGEDPAKRGLMLWRLLPLRCHEKSGRPRFDSVE